MFVTGEIYNRRRDIHKLYKGQEQGGISTPANFPLMFIFTSDTGEEYGYKDEFRPDGTFWYTGEGQAGNMEMTRGNLAIKNHQQNGKAIHLFEYVRQGVVRYVGEAIYLDHHVETRPDVNNEKREAIIFELDIIASTTSKEITSPLLDNTNRREMNFRTKSLDELRKIAESKPSRNSSQKDRKIIIYQRSAAVKFYALKRANGICECCSQPAPFYSKDNIPFLEVHHIRRRADNGPDEPRGVAAICPNCHKEVHYGKEGEDLNKKVDEYINTIED
ncbi:HNH endonuclease [Bacteroidota bacterium]